MLITPQPYLSKNSEKDAPSFRQDFTISDVSLSIMVNRQKVGPLIEHLVENGIPFSLNYRNEPSENNEKAEYKKIKEQKQKAAPKSNLRENKMTPLEKIHHKYIESGTYDELPNLTSIAQELNITPTTFKKQFEKKYGRSFSELFLQSRMQKASTLLKKGYKCNEVSQMVGYGEKSAIKFNKMFQRHFGLTPKKYQMEHHGSLNKRNSV